MNRAGMVRAAKVLGFFLVAATVLLVMELFLGAIGHGEESGALSALNRRGPIYENVARVPGMEHS